MQLSHTRPVASAFFDEPNLVMSAGLVPLMVLAGKARLREPADGRLTVPTDRGAYPGLKISSQVAGMVAGGAAEQPAAVVVGRLLSLLVGGMQP